jgi:hypothetical protein
MLPDVIVVAPLATVMTKIPVQPASAVGVVCVSLVAAIPALT